MSTVKLPSPCFVLEEDKLRANLSVIKHVADQSGVNIILAFKGFSMWSAFSLVRTYIEGATASSLHELMLCNQEMQSKAHTYCVAYKEDEIGQILDGSSHITFNSINQFHKYAELAKSKGVSIGLRVNPETSDVETELYNPASPQSRLGVTSEELYDVVLEGLEGLHFHVLCESSVVSLRKVLEAVETKFEPLLHQVKWVNMGGGHLITRRGYDIEELICVLKAFKTKYNIDVILEPGSAFAWQTGFLRTQVLDVVERNGMKTAIIDASFTCHMPDCLEMPYRPEISEGYEDETIGKYKYRLGGVSCLAGDYLESYSFDKELKIGDTITFMDMMHYTMVKTSTFNGIQHPAIAIIRIDGSKEVVKTFGYDSFKERLS